MSIGTKISIPLIVLGFLIGVIFIYSQISFNEEKRFLDDITADAQKSILLTSQLSVLQKDIEKNLLSFNFDPNKRYIDSIHRAENKILDLFDEFGTSFQTERERELLQSFKESRNESQSLENELIAAIQTEDEKAIALAFERWSLQSQRVIAILDDLTKLNSQNFSKSIDIIEEERQIFIKLLMFSLMLTLVVIVVSLVVYEKIFTVPLKKMMISAKAISRGDLDVKIDVHSKDEIGQLAAAFNSMTHELKDFYGALEKKVKEKTSELTKTLRIFKMEKDKIQTIIESIGDGVFVIDSKYKIKLFNRAAEQLSGFSAEEAIGKPYEAILQFVLEGKGDKRSDKFIKRVIEKGKIDEMSRNTVLIRKNGDRLPVADSAAPLLNYKGKVVGCVVVFRDVTNERKIDRMKTEFVAVASHQLRTPLTAIRWGIEMIMFGKDKISDSTRHNLDDVYSATQRMINLVNSLLNVSRLETGRLKIEPIPMSLEKIIESVVKELLPISKARNNDIIFKKPKPALPKLLIDEGLFRQVINNVIGNAVKYTINPHGKVEIAIHKDKSGYIISVRDEGIGIPKSAKAKIFEKFFRADNAISTETDGNGLGLYIGRMVMNASGGDIWFESEVGKGTTFYIKLPLKGMRQKKGQQGLV